jgi:tellurite resistance protein TerC
MSTPLWAWASTVGVIAAVVALDLFVLHRKPRPVSFKEAATWSGVWVLLAVAFGAVIWMARGGDDAGSYFAGYLIEKTLSVDNVFVLAVILSTFAVPAHLQHRLLNWGVLGALCFRAAFIAGGVAALESLQPLLYVVGAFLVVTGIRLATREEVRMNPGRNPLVRLVGRALPVTDGYQGTRVVVRRRGRFYATPLLAALIAVETTDLVFAVDSIPAVLAITTDPFLVFVSNAFALLGLRALYFLLAGMMDRFSLLRVGLAAVLGFVGVKMLAADLVHIPVVVSLVVIVSIIVVSVVASLRRRPADPAPEAVDAGSPYAG